MYQITNEETWLIETETLNDMVILRAIILTITSLCDAVPNHLETHR